MGWMRMNWASTHLHGWPGWQEEAEEGEAVPEANVRLHHSCSRPCWVPVGALMRYQGATGGDGEVLYSLIGNRDSSSLVGML